METTKYTKEVIKEKLTTDHKWIEIVKQYTDGSVKIPYTFLHGQLNTDNSYDLFGVIGISEDQLKEGKIDCYYKGKPCTLFLWINPKYNHLTGICCYNDDKDTFKRCENLYNNKCDIF